MAATIATKFCVFTVFALSFVWTPPLCNGDAVLYSPNFYSGSMDRVGGQTQRHLDGSPGTPVVNLLWSLFSDKGNVAVTPAVLSDGSIVYATTSGYVSRVSSDSHTMWSVWMGSVRSSPILDAQENIYFGCVDGKLYVLTSGGQLKWTFQTGLDIVGSVVITQNNIVALPSRDGYLYFISATTGALAYKYNFGAEVRGTPAQLRDGAVVCGSLAGVIVVINTDYTIRWTYNAMAPISSAPMVGDTQIVFTTRNSASMGGMTISLNMDGSLKWQLNTSMMAIDTTPTLGPNEIVYVGAADGRVYAINTDGSLLWKYMTGFSNSSPTICKNSLIFVSTNKFVYGLSMDGIFLWKYQLIRGTTVTPTCVNVPANSSVTAYIGSNDQTLYAINHNF